MFSPEYFCPKNVKISGTGGAANNVVLDDDDDNIKKDIWLVVAVDLQSLLLLKPGYIDETGGN